MKKNIELIKGLEYYIYGGFSFVLIVRFNSKLYCIRFSEQSEKDLATYGYLFNIHNIDMEFNQISASLSIKEIEKYHNTKPILDLKDRFSKYLLKELKKELLTK